MAFRQFKLEKKIRYTWSDQNSSSPKVLQNFKKTPNCTRWPKELNQKGFPRNIKYRTRPKSPPFQSFSALRDFFSGKMLSPKGSPFNFLEFCDFQFFLALWDFFQILFFHKRVHNSPILWHFEVLFLFLSLRYGADLGCYRLVLN